MPAVSTTLQILVVGLNYRPEKTGVGPYTSEAAEMLAAHGHRVHVVTAYPHYPQWRFRPAGPEDDGDGRDLTVTRVRHQLPRRHTRLWRAWSEVTFGMRAVTTRWGSPDVVLLVSPALVSSALVLLRARLSRRRPHVGLWIQDVYSKGVAELGGGSGSARLLAWIERRVAKAVDGVCVLHDGVARIVVDEFGVPVDRVTVVRNWSRVEPAADVDRAEARRRLGWPSHWVTVLHSGALGAKQGMDTVVGAAELAARSGSPVHFVVVGDGSARAGLQRRAAGLPSITFVDPLDDDDYDLALAAADVLLVNERPGLREMALPSKLTTYFNAGRPVLAATEVGSLTMKEIAASGGGIVVPPGIPEELLAAAERLADDKTASAALGRRGREYCRAVLSRESSYERLAAWVAVLAGSDMASCD